MVSCGALGRGRPGDQRGAVLVEMALVALVLSLLFGATVEFGRLMFSAQALQDVARVAARELAVAPLPADFTFEDALDEPIVRDRIYDERLLVIDLDDPATDTDAEIDAFFAGAPVVNRALRPLMIVDIVDQPARRLRLLRFPGTLLADADPGSPTGLAVAIPRVTARDADGVETIEWLRVLEEIRPDPADPATGPFSASPASPLPDNQRGMVALRINYPYQAGALTGFAPNPAGPFEPNIENPLTADDLAAEAYSAPPPSGLALLPDDPDAVGAYAGRLGLGRQLAFGGRTVRPFRRLLSAQAIYRREVLGP